MTRGRNTATNWPRMYLLQLYSEAVKHGFIWVNELTEAEADSLRMTLYRLRRRSDGPNAASIPPEYLQVTVGGWERTEAYVGNGGIDSSPPLGRIPIIYSLLPSGRTLPRITTPEDGELPPMAKPVPPATPAIPSADLITMAGEQVVISDEAVESYVDRLRRRVESGGDTSTDN